MEIKELKDTVVMMGSSDYKERFKAEYHQLNIRINKLVAVVDGYVDGTLSFTPSCPIHLLRRQIQSMAAYRSILQERARIEGIKL